MGLYSHSKLGTYETCRLQYKYRYIDKIKVDTDTIERYLGRVVHSTLEKLYKDLLMGKMNSKENLIGYYEKLWERDWHDKIIIVSHEYEANHYWKRGERCILDYYDEYHPFDQGKTLGLESKIIFDIDREGKHKIRGLIDRLTYVGAGVYEIHDYKTSKTPPTEEALREDKQLALYQIYVQERFKDAKTVKLIWHYLVFGKEFFSQRNSDQLDELKEKTVRLIEEIEGTEDFCPKESSLCPWCDYQYLCPLRKHLVRMESVPLNEYLKDDGVKLVNKYVELQENERLIKKDIGLLKEALLDYSKREGCDVIRGNSHKLRISEEAYWSFPGTSLKEKPIRQELEKLLKESGKLEEVSHLDVKSLSSNLIKGRWSEDLLQKVKGFGTPNVTYRINSSKLKDDDIAD